ncbi:MAG TPA: MBL fold metallo-hydrolase, partial [Candidatus Deferrimicrobiaceae bacterium]
MEVGPLAVNAYVVEDPAARKAVVVDPGGDGEALLAEIGGLGLTVEKILLTHGHFDHVGAVGVLREKTGAPVDVHADDVERMLGARR